MPRASSLRRVVVLEDHVLFAESLEIALAVEGHHAERVEVAQHPTSASLLAAALRTRPHIAILDLDLGHQQGLRVVDPLTRAGVAVVVVTGENDQARWGECLAAGARAVLPKTGPLNSIMAAIRKIGDGQAAMGPDDRTRVLDAYRAESAAARQVRDRLGTLTHREQAILGRLMRGHHVHDIARTSYVSEATVRTQVKSILSKLDVSSQLAAVAAAHSVSWCTPPGPEAPDTTS